MDTELHGYQVEVLVQPLRRHWAEREDVYVAGNMAMYFSAAQIKKNDFIGPDVFVVLDTIRRMRKSWVVWQEERTPDLVIELLSPSTEANDRGPKMQIYAKVLRVPEYFLYDPETGVFEGYRLDTLRGTYRPMPRDEDGGYTSLRTGLRLAIHHSLHYGEMTPLLRWFTGEGDLILTAEEAADLAEREAEAAQREAEAAQREAEAAQREVEAAQREAEAAQREVEAAQREVEAAQREAEAAQREAEAQRARASRLEAQLRALGIDPQAS